jgi:hypothetical protein
MDRAAAPVRTLLCDRFRGFTSPPPAQPYSLSALERYQDCPSSSLRPTCFGWRRVRKTNRRAVTARGDSSTRSSTLLRGLGCARRHDPEPSASAKPGGSCWKSPSRCSLTPAPGRRGAGTNTPLWVGISTGCVDIDAWARGLQSNRCAGAMLEYRFEGEFEAGWSAGTPACGSAKSPIASTCSRESTSGDRLQIWQRAQPDTR